MEDLKHTKTDTTLLDKSRQIHRYPEASEHGLYGIDAHNKSIQKYYRASNGNRINKDTIGHYKRVLLAGCKQQKDEQL